MLFSVDCLFSFFPALFIFIFLKILNKYKYKGTIGEKAKVEKNGILWILKKIRGFFYETVEAIYFKNNHLIKINGKIHGIF